jgi:hypothetical protein
MSLKLKVVVPECIETIRFTHPDGTVQEFQATFKRLSRADQDNWLQRMDRWSGVFDETAEADASAQTERLTQMQAERVQLLSELFVQTDIFEGEPSRKAQLDFILNDAVLFNLYATAAAQAVINAGIVATKNSNGSAQPG